MRATGRKSTDLLSLVGGTPLVELHHMSPRPGMRIFAKLEENNPSGSIKDRIVMAMVNAADERGDLHTGDTVDEASSGHTFIALATVAKQRGFGVHVVVPRDVVPSIGDILPAMDAEITWCDSKAGMKGVRPTLAPRHWTRPTGGRTKAFEPAPER